MVSIDYDESYCAVVVEASWLAAHWKQKLDDNNAIVMWSTCYSANPGTNGISVKEAAGGRWRSGYVEPTIEYEAETVNREFLQRMNGTVANGKLRTAGAAYNDNGIGVDYYSYIRPVWNATTLQNDQVTFTNGTVKMDGNYWTTLCPAPLAIDPVYPDSFVNEKRKGFGCILFDTTLEKTDPASDAVQKESGGAIISDTYWLEDATTEKNVYGVGFTFDKTSDNAQTTMKAISTQIKNQGAEGRQMDGDRIQPNNDDREWSY